MPKKTRKEKEEIVAGLRDKVSRQTATILTQMKGLTVAEATDLRKSIRHAGGEFKVTKNTLLKIAAKETSLEPLTKDLVGPTALVFAYEDPASVAKAIKTFSRGVPKLTPFAGVLGGKTIDGEDIATLAELPGKDELLSQLVGTIGAPLNGFMRTLAGIPRRLLFVLAAIEGKKNTKENNGTRRK